MTSHKDKLFSSNSLIKKEDFDRIFGISQSRLESRPVKPVAEARNSSDYDELTGEAAYRRLSGK